MFKNIYIRWIIMPGILFAIGFIISLFLNPPATFSVLVHSYDRQSFIHYQSSPLLKGQLVDAKFVAQNNNLGIVAVRINSNFESSKPSVIFRMRDMHDKNWYYSHAYNIGKIARDNLYTFGFPIITDSKGREYYFQLISQNGNENRSVSISTAEPIFVVKSQFSKADIRSSLKFFFLYVLEKSFNFISNPWLYFSSLIFFYPFFLYIFWQGGRLLSLNKDVSIQWIIIAAVCVGIIYIVITMSLAVPFSTELFFILWYYLVRRHRLASDISFLLSIVFFCTSPMYEVMSYSLYAEKSMYWSISFLIFAMVQVFVENYKNSKGLIHYSQVINAILAQI